MCKEDRSPLPGWRNSPESGQCSCQEQGSWLVRHVCLFSSCHCYWVDLSVGQCLWGDHTGFGSRALGICCMARVLARPVSCSSVHRHRFCSGGLCILHFQKHSTGQLCTFGWAVLPFPHCLLPVRKNSPSCSMWGHKRDAEQQLVSLLLPLCEGFF